MKYDEALMILKQYGQEHLLAYYDELEDYEKHRLLDQIEGIDFELITNLIQMAKEGKEKTINKEDITPIPFIVKEDLSASDKELYSKIGLGLVEKGQYAVVTMAGGQGTRLGHTGPKGTYRIGLPSGMSLFEIQCKRLLRLGSNIPWYIMTSKENDKETKEFFASNNYSDTIKIIYYFLLKICFRWF